MAFLIRNKANRLPVQMRDGIGKDKKMKTYNIDIYTYYENEPIIDLSNKDYYDFMTDKKINAAIDALANRIKTK